MYLMILRKESKAEIAEVLYFQCNIVYPRIFKFRPIGGAKTGAAFRIARLT